MPYSFLHTPRIGLVLHKHAKITFKFNIIILFFKIIFNKMVLNIFKCHQGAEIQVPVVIRSNDKLYLIECFDKVLSQGKHTSK